MSEIKTYDPKDVVITFNGERIEGFLTEPYAFVGDPMPNLVTNYDLSFTCEGTLTHLSPTIEEVIRIGRRLARRAQRRRRLALWKKRGRR